MVFVVVVVVLDDDGDGNDVALCCLIIPVGLLTESRRTVIMLRFHAVTPLLLYRIQVAFYPQGSFILCGQA